MLSFKSDTQADIIEDFNYTSRYNPFFIHFKVSFYIPKRVVSL